MGGRLGPDLRGPQVRRVPDVRDRHHHRRPELRDPVPGHPEDKDGNSVYKGPYVTKGNDTAAFDKAVVCDGNKITFNLAKPVGDFNFTVTLTAFAPVPKAADTGEKYDDKPVSNGPYKIQEYTKGSQLVLVRNENWDPATDDYRPAYPDKIVSSSASSRRSSTSA